MEDQQVNEMYPYLCEEYTSKNTNCPQKLTLWLFMTIAWSINNVITVCLFMMVYILFKLVL